MNKFYDIIRKLNCLDIEIGQLRREKIFYIVCLMLLVMLLFLFIYIEDLTPFAVGLSAICFCLCPAKMTEIEFKLRTLKQERSKIKAYLTALKRYHELKATYELMKETHK